MPIIFKNKNDRRAFQFGHHFALRSTNEMVEQLQEQLRKERAQHRFDLAEKDRELALVLRELAEARYELARRDTAAAFANAPSPSAMLH
jgi:hypothetical protein